MTNDQDSKAPAHSEQNESVFVRRVVRVKEFDAVLVQEGRLSFFKRNPVFPSVGSTLTAVPLEAQIRHMYSVRIMLIPVNACRQFSLTPR